MHTNSQTPCCVVMHRNYEANVERLLNAFKTTSQTELQKKKAIDEVIKKHPVRLEAMESFVMVHIVSYDDLKEKLQSITDQMKDMKDVRKHEVQCIETHMVAAAVVANTMARAVLGPNAPQVCTIRYANTEPDGNSARLEKTIAFLHELNVFEKCAASNQNNETNPSSSHAASSHAASSHAAPRDAEEQQINNTTALRLSELCAFVQSKLP